ncbi:putative Heme peroxidase-domain-containing protein [Seiridium cardinale]|uniref:Heme peroxidase-domain-containing protein n=1 Tax=Seiridium cardinale TaxID=138064 RepID=A0ABR2XMG3_9PEZI
MSSDTTQSMSNGRTNGSVNGNTSTGTSSESEELRILNQQLKDPVYLSKFHGDPLLGDKIKTQTSYFEDFRKIFSFQNAPALSQLAGKLLAGKGPDMHSGAQIVASLATNSKLRAMVVENGVKTKYERMLHPPLTYLGDAFKYRQADGKFNSALHPHLGQAGAPYAKTVPSQTHPLGALPDPGDIFDRLMARDDKGRQSASGLSSMLVYHATIIIHDIFRTNDKDKNISDTSSYLDLSPLYGFTDAMQRKVRDDKYKLGLLKPDTFAEDRLLRQPPGVCIILVMYNRYHNYAATQLRRINENNRFAVPEKYALPKAAAAAKLFVRRLSAEQYKQSLDLLGVGEDDLFSTTNDEEYEQFKALLDTYSKKWKSYEASGPIKEPMTKDSNSQKEYDDYISFQKLEKRLKTLATNAKAGSLILEAFALKKDVTEDDKKKIIEESKAVASKSVSDFEKAHVDAWNKLDDDLFNTARLITCGMYIQVSIHDYLRALMGFHQFDTTFTLDPRVAEDHKNVSRGLGNQVTIEFNLLYRFHCAISLRDEVYTESFLNELKALRQFDWKSQDPTKQGQEWSPKDITLEQFAALTRGPSEPKEPCDQEFGLLLDPKYSFKRNKDTQLFDDQQMIDELLRSMDEPISNFGPRNVPKCLKPVEILGILQARKWEIGTLNDFREFFQMKRHETFESITKHPGVQTALRDLYEHPDKVEFYPGIFCESGADLNADPGPSDLDSALWAAIFSDAITLVRSDRFYTVDWNTNSLTSWGMKEVTPDNDNLKSSVFHRLIQRAFPEWFPYDSVRFFHPFYTSEQNATYAKQQGYEKTFKMEKTVVKNDRDQDIKIWDNPSKPIKPIYLKDITKINAVLTDQSDKLVHPARLRLKDMPLKVAEILKPRKDGFQAKVQSPIKTDDSALTKYFVDLMRDIIKREFIVMDKSNPARPIYQIDITRDVAIPVVTRYVAELLGFADKVRSDTNTNAKYSENEIYQHITNCQMYLSYNADETKLIRRRKAFISSMDFLYELTKNGHIRDVSLWGRFLGALWPFGSPPSAMKKLGLDIAREVLNSEGDTGRSAAILLLIGLDSAYQAVVAFTSVLNLFIRELYQQAEKDKEDRKTSTWQQLQTLAFDDTEKALSTISAIVLKAQKSSVRLPIVRKAVQDCKFPNDANPLFEIRKGQTVVCDLYAAEANSKLKSDDETDYLSYQSTFTDKFASYHPKHIAALSLTAMIKTLAQMKNLRRSHHDQGHLKKIKLDASYEGYSNYMAPMRMQKIGYDVNKALEEDLPKQREEAREALAKATKEDDAEAIKAANDSLKAADQREKSLKELFSTKILRPATDTYMTPEWDEMVPFPTTWKVRFDGFGPSDYGGENLTMLQRAPVPDDQPPWYQPNGPSHVGGSFATWNHLETKALPDLAASAAQHKDHLVSTGCGLPHVAPA